MIINLNLFNVNVPPAPAINTYELRDSVRTPVTLYLINTLFSYKNGKYYFTYLPILQGLADFLGAVPTVSSALPLDQDALLYSAGSNPLSDYTNLGAWVTSFDSVLRQELLTLDAKIRRYDKSAPDPDPDLILGSDGLYYFQTTNPKNLAYTVATAKGWVPPEGADPNTMYPILLGTSDTILFKLRCAFTPSTIQPIYYDINILMWYALAYVNTYNNTTYSLPQQPNTLVELASFVSVFGALPPGRSFVGWLLDGTVYPAGQSINMAQDTTVLVVFDPPL